MMKRIKASSLTSLGGKGDAFFGFKKKGSGISLEKKKYADK